MSAQDVDPFLRDSLRAWIGRIAAALLFVLGGVRFMSGHTVVALLDIGWAASLVVLLAWLRWVGHGAAIGIAMAMVSMLFSVIRVDQLGSAGLYWLFPVALGTFAVTRRGVAAAVSAAGIGYAGVVTAPFPTVEAEISFLAAALVTVAVAWICTRHVVDLRARLEHLATRDALTGAGNRRALEHALERIVASRGTGEPAALATLDIDHFKRVNDTHGHAVGDRVLTELVALLQPLLRPHDRVFRYGGEEFVLLMANMPREEALGLMNLVNAAVKQRIRVRQEPVTVSIGLAIRGQDESASEWMSRADAALYRAKTGGRDRVEEAPP